MCIGHATTAVAVVSRTGADGMESSAYENVAVVIVMWDALSEAAEVLPCVYGQATGSPNLRADESQRRP
jgi:hypothetical protein